jgi:tRNA threonylcarbamoyl adenosine modification protein YeaZ
MKILALEFSSAQRSVAVLNTAAGGRGCASSEVVDSAPRNTMKPLAMVETVLRDVGLEREQIECIAIGLGPGSYTGLRAAIALAQGWQLGREVKVVGVSSAECIAARAQTDGMRGLVSVVIDAQRQEIYLASYELDANGVRELEALRLAKPEEAAIRARAGQVLIGPEVTRWFPDARLIHPSAAVIAELASKRNDFVAAERLEPIYLRETTFVKAPPARTIPV